MQHVSILYKQGAFFVIRTGFTTRIYVFAKNIISNIQLQIIIAHYAIILVKIVTFHHLHKVVLVAMQILPKHIDYFILILIMNVPAFWGIMMMAVV